MQLSGIGVGRAIATGPVRRMPDPLPEPSESESPADPVAEIARTR